jgi:hypothetical protein
MRKLFAAVLFASSLLSLTAARATGEWCGVGCHATLQGACVVDGWGFLPPGTTNECPAGARTTPRCPRGFAWKFKACFPSD